MRYLGHQDLCLIANRLQLLIVFSLLFGNKANYNKGRSKDPKSDLIQQEQRAEIGTLRVLLIHPNFLLHHVRHKVSYIGYKTDPCDQQEYILHGA